MTSRRGLLGASVGPWASVVISRYAAELGAQADRYAQDPRTEHIATDLRRALNSMAASADQVRPAGPAPRPRVIDDDAADGKGSGVGLTSGEVACRLGLSSSRRVLQLVREGRLEGGMVKGVWRIDEASVAIEESRRSEDRK